MSVKQPKIQNITDQIRESTYLAQGRENIRTQEQQDIVTLGNIANKTYAGVNLISKFSQEIANYDNEWAWIKNRITNGNYDGLNIGDYIPVTCSNNATFNACIAGINTYKGYGDTTVGNHIDFISASLWSTTFPMNKKNFNNGLSATENLTGDGTTTEFTLTKHFPSVTEVKIGGTATTAYTYDAANYKITFTTAPENDAAIVVTCGRRLHPWLVSNGYYFLNSLAGEVPNGTGNNPAMEAVDYTEGGVFYYLPAALKAVIVEKRMYLAQRYSDTAIQSEDTGGGWQNIGKLWLPTEFEITGAKISNDSRFSAMGSVQYPLFANNMNRMIGRYYWWTVSALGASSAGFVNVNSYGNMYAGSANSAFRGPVCFRIA